MLVQSHETIIDDGRPLQISLNQALTEVIDAERGAAARLKLQRSSQESIQVHTHYLKSQTVYANESC